MRICLSGHYSLTGEIRLPVTKSSSKCSCCQSVSICSSLNSQIRAWGSGVNKTRGRVVDSFSHSIMEG